LDNIFDHKKLRRTVGAINHKIDELLCEGLQFDAIVFTGNSGAGVCYPLAYEHGYNIICMRKDTEPTHEWHLEGTRCDVRNYIIVDDLIGTGDTIARIIKAIGSSCKCVGVVLYRSYDDITQFHGEEYTIPVYPLKVF
jgi:adenine/guanine phosphoribosyltransferase-like PRPP-binding protein